MRYTIMMITVFVLFTGCKKKKSTPNVKPTVAKEFYVSGFQEVVLPNNVSNTEHMLSYTSDGDTPFVLYTNLDGLPEQLQISTSKTADVTPFKLTTKYKSVLAKPGTYNVKHSVHTDSGVAKDYSYIIRINKTSNEECDTFFWARQSNKEQFTFNGIKQEYVKCFQIHENDKNQPDTSSHGSSILNLYYDPQNGGFYATGFDVNQSSYKAVSGNFTFKIDCNMNKITMDTTDAQVLSYMIGGVFNAKIAATGSIDLEHNSFFIKFHLLYLDTPQPNSTFYFSVGNYLNLKYE